jgi:hypothetical protein
MVWFPVTLAGCQVLRWRGAKINFSGHFTAAIRQLLATGIRGSNQNNRLKREKGGLIKSPFITYSLALRS